MTRWRDAALRRIKSALKEVFETAEVPDFIVEGYNIFQPYISVAPYVYIYYAAAELERQELPRRGVWDVLLRVIRPEKRG